MKAKDLWRVWLMSLAAAVCLSACGGDDLFEPDPPTPPTPPSPPTETTGEVNFSISTEGGGTGSGTAADPAVAQCGDTLSVAITEKSSYTDPNGTVFSCEPKAVIQLFTAADTLYVKDLQTLLDVKEVSNDQSQTSQANMKTMQRLQRFNVGGKEVTFDLAHEVYTYVNSEQTAIEMPYVKLNPAQYGSADVTEAGDLGELTSVRNIRLKRISPMNGSGPRRVQSITDSIAYDVSVSFTLNIEPMNTQNQTLQTMSFEVDFAAVVETVTEYPDPQMSFEYELAHKSGTNSAASPYNVILGEPLSLEWQQKASYQYFSVSERTGMEIKYEPKAYVQVNAAKADTIWVNDVSELENVNKPAPTITNNGDNPVENVGSQTFEVANGQKVNLKWGYQSYKPVQVEGTEVKLPYLTLSAPEISNVKVAEVQNGVLVGKKGKLYTVTATIDQDLATVNASEPKSEHLQYVVKYLAAIAEETPQPATLVAIKYRKGYEWFEPHDNIPLTYQYIVYRDSIFSDGSIHTMESRSGKTTMEWTLNIGSNHGHYDQRKEDVRGVTVYYFARQSEFSETEVAYRNGKVSRKIAVPDISVVTLEKDPPSSNNPEQLDLYPGYDVNTPKVGWYWRDFFCGNRAYICNNYAGGGGFLTLFDITSRWYNHILYVEDGLNGGQLVTFLGDENDIDDVDYRAQFDFSFTEEETTMPTGEPAKVFSHKCITTFLGRQFHYEVVDSVYQYDPAHPPF